MSGPFGSSQWMYSSGGFYPTEIEQSLRFNDNDSAYLSWTPASAGNRKTWTFSAWVKRGNIGVDAVLYGAGNASGNHERFRFTSTTHKLNIFYDYGGTNYGGIQTSSVFRDTSAWYHVLLSMDTTQVIASDRAKIYVNGILQPVDNINIGIAQNFEWNINNSIDQRLGGWFDGGSTFQYMDGYLAEVNFIDGQALDPTDFGEFKSGVWVAKEYTGSYGTNGFYLPFKQTTVANGFNTVTWTGGNTYGGNSVEGVGFQPDLVWVKSRSDAYSHLLYDSIRGTGATAELSADQTVAEGGTSSSERGYLNSFDADGFSSVIGSSGDNLYFNQSGRNYVAWCWDAGSGSPVSNTNGSITSTVKANPDYGFSVVTWTGTNGAGANEETVGHGLNSAPEFFWVKARSASHTWWCGTTVIDGSMDVLLLQSTDAKVNSASNVPTSSIFNVGGTSLNENGTTYVAYCFHSVSGYSSISSYSGTGANGNSITTGFPVAFVMIKRTDTTGNWIIFDKTRDTADLSDAFLYPNSSAAEGTSATKGVEFTDTGFILQNDYGDANASGGTYIYIAFADTRDAAFWRDLSGNDNTWQPNALQNSDVMPDSPTQNWATLNPTIRPYTVTSVEVKSEGNLKISNTGSGVTGSGWATFNVNSGKWYYEAAVVAAGGNIWIGWSNDATKAALGTYTAALRDYGYTYKKDGNKCNNSATGTSYGASYTTGDIIGVALDIDAGTLEFYKNGVSQGVAFTGVSANGGFIAGVSVDPSTTTVVANFGQDSSFAGNKAPQGNTDDNGVGDFFYAPPSGYLALCTANLPDPAIDPAQDDVPADYFGTLLYSGNGGTQSVSGLTFQPDLVWIKSRSANVFAWWHQVTDAVRGVGNRLNTNDTGAELFNAQALQSFDSDGFTVGSDNSYNNSSESYVGWSWLAGNGTSSNTSGSITSTVSVNQKAGFSIVSWTGTGITGATVGHGLNQKPSALIIKNRTTANRWLYYTDVIDGTYDFLELNSTAAATSSGLSLYTNSVFSVFNAADSNSLGDDFIAYVFAEVEGYSKFGSYTGNGSTDGPFIFTNHRPAWIMVKRTNSSADWVILDTIRDDYNIMLKRLDANTSSAENTAASYLDAVSNGFKVRTTNGNYNTSGGTYIYMAFAENPFKYANAR